MDLYQQAIAQFQELFTRLQEFDNREPAAMTLATADARGRVSARMVLLRGVDEQGFVFYTNTLSLKGQQIRDNPRAALCFYWPQLDRQVRVEGAVGPVSEREADQYWAGRARLSQVGAWASKQSEPLADRETLQERVAAAEARYEGQDVPRPSHWSGYRIKPDMIEFWTAMPGRLHERERYFLDGSGWRRTLLYP
jgi:pyridoxamine 5'-phosphate oxidase